MSVALPQLAPGETLAGYRIESLLGRGRTGVVYKAVQLSLGRPVALKLLLPELADDSAFRERFLREAHLAASLEHPHVLPIYEMGQVAGLLFLSMRYVDATDLAALLTHGALSPARAVRIVAQLASALQAADACGLVHGDVRPANVLLAGPAGEEDAYLTGFGLARQLGGSAPPATGDYRAPEQIVRGDADARSDVYALGCVLFACLTGRPPPSANARGKDIPPPPLGDVIVRARAENATERYQRIEELGRAAQEALITAEPSTSRAQTPTNLPSPPTPLVGRERELAELAQLLRNDDVRLLTLIGPPGSGKTRLALALGSTALEDFPDGVFFVELASLAEPTLVGPTIAQTLGVKESGTEPLLNALTERLAAKAILLVVDNFEHLLEGAPLLSDLLAGAEALKIVATSRARLQLTAEHDFALAPLAEEDAVELFTERARAAQPSFVLDGDRAIVGEICRQLEGLPLALELAAARVKVLPPKSLLARLEQRLPLLTSGVRDAPERQRTMRATIQWSYELLGSAEQELLTRLAVFAGGCTLEAAEQVCGADLDTLATLVDNSLLQQGHDRFAMLETIREYAFGQLEDSGVADDVRRRHAEFYLALSERVDPKLAHQQEQVASLELLAAEHENLRAALTWALECDPEETALRLGASLCLYFVFRSVTEGRQWLAEVLELGGTAARVERAEVLTGAGQLAQAQGAYAEARALYEDGLRIRRDLADARGVADSLHYLGWLALHQGEYERARSVLEESLSLWRSRTNEPARIGSLNILGIVALYQADNARAESLFRECLAIARDRGDQVGLARAINNLSLVSIYRGDFEQAVSQAEESLRLFRELAWPEGVADSLDNLGRAALGLGDYARARELFVESLLLSRQVGDKWGIAECIEGLAGVATASAADERAARLYGAAASLQKTIDAISPPVDRAEHERRASHARQRLGDEAWTRAYEVGKALTLEQAVEVALET